MEPHITLSLFSNTHFSHPNFPGRTEADFMSMIRSVFEKAAITEGRVLPLFAELAKESTTMCGRNHPVRLSCISTHQGPAPPLLVVASPDSLRPKVQEAGVWRSDFPFYPEFSRATGIVRCRGNLEEEGHRPPAGNPL